MKPQPSVPAPALFDRALHRHYRRRAAAGFSQTHFLFAEAAARAADRLRDIARPFARALLLGSHQGLAGAAVAASGRVGQWVEAEEIAEMHGAHPVLPRTFDFERLPPERDAWDAIVSVGSLHWVNDLIGTLIQARLALQPDGLFLAVLPGARSLIELRQALLAAGMEAGLSPRLSPLVDVRDAGNLLSRAGFALPVADSELLRVSYPDLRSLLCELRAMGEGNALLQRSRIPTTRGFWRRVEELYRAQSIDPEGRLPMTVELVTLTAWKPHASQPQPARRGSGQVPLGQVLS